VSLKGVAIALSYSAVLWAQLMVVAVVDKAAQGQIPLGYWKFNEGSGNDCV